MYVFMDSSWGLEHVYPISRRGITERLQLIYHGKVSRIAHTSL